MSNAKVKTGIIGGAGYTGGDLLRLLVHHPDVEITFVHSCSNAGKAVSDIHSDLIGDIDLIFTDRIKQDIDVLFLCVGHGEAKKFIAENGIAHTTRIIDLSQDFRIVSITDADNREFIYGLSELNSDKIRSAKNIANPGCFATAIQLALLPLAANSLLTKPVHVTATTGSTGAGQSFSNTSHFSWRQNNLSAYKAFTHQHLAEIYQSLHSVNGKSHAEIFMIPLRGSFTRGILATLYTECSLNETEVQDLFSRYYKGQPFVFLSKHNPDLKQVVNTNKCILYIEKHKNQLMITSLIDNLLKGASGQAVQNMNLMFGLEETAGLRLKASAF